MRANQRQAGRRLRAIAAASVAGMVLQTRSSLATTYTFIGADSASPNSWNDAANWSTAVANGNGTSVNRINFAGNATLVFDPLDAALNGNDPNGNYTSANGNVTFGGNGTRGFVVGGTASAVESLVIDSGNFTTNGNASFQDVVGFSQGTGSLIVNGGSYTANTGLSLDLNGGNGTSGALTVNNGTVTLGYLGLGDGSGASGGNATVNLNGGLLNLGGITYASPSSAVLNLNGGTLQAGANLSIGNFTSVTIGGNATSPVTIDTNGHSIMIGNALLDSGSGTDGGVTKVGNGTLTFSGPNTFTGNTTINNGIVTYTNGTAFATNSPIVVNSGGTAQIQGGITGGNAAITLNSATSASGATGSLENVSGNNSYGGTITLNGTGSIYISSDAGTLTLNGATAITGAHSLALAGSGNGVINGAITTSAANTVVKTGNGTWTLAGANTFTGATTISAGILNYRNGTALAAYSPITVGSGGTLQIQGNISGGTMGITLNNMAFASGATGSIENVSGNNSFAGNITLNNTGPLYISSDAGTLLLSGNITGLHTLGLTGAGNGVISGVIATGSTSVQTTGTGTWVFSGANTYSGVTNIEDGIINYQNSTAFGQNGNIAVFSGATAQVQGGIAGGGYTMTIAGIGAPAATAALENVSGNNSFSGNIILGGNATIAVDSGTLSIGGTISAGNNSYSLTKVGVGTLQSTYTNSSGTPFGNGNIVLNAGTLALAPTYYEVVTGAAISANTTFTYGGGGVTLQLTRASGHTLTYTVGNSTTSTSALVRANNGTLVINPSAIANLGNSTTGNNTNVEDFVVNGLSAGANKNGAATSAGIYDASVVDQGGTGNSGIGGFVKYGTNGFQDAASGTTAYTARSGSSFTTTANEIADVTTSNTITDSGNHAYAMRLGAVTATLASTVTINGGSAGSTNSGIGGLILNPTAVASVIQSGTLDFGSSEAAIYVGSGSGGGSISSPMTGSGGLTKFGPGVLSLSGGNSGLSGAVNVNQGMLQIASSSAFPTAAIKINAGGTFGGNATNTGATVTINSGGTLTAGADSAHYGTLGTGAQTWNGGGAYIWKIQNAGTGGVAANSGSSGSNGLPTGSGNAGSDWDLVTMSSLNVTNAGANVPFTIAPTGALTTSAAEYSWVIGQVAGTGNLTLSGGIALGSNLLTTVPTGGASDAFALNTSGFTVNSIAAPSSSLFSLEFVAIGGNDDLVLSYNAAPEPGAGLLALAGGAPLLLTRRRRRKKSN